jgi:hypothetical protein
MGVGRWDLPLVSKQIDATDCIGPHRTTRLSGPTRPHAPRGIAVAVLLSCIFWLNSS